MVAVSKVGSASAVFQPIKSVGAALHLPHVALSVLSRDGSRYSGGQRQVAGEDIRGDTLRLLQTTGSGPE